MNPDNWKPGDVITAVVVFTFFCAPILTGCVVCIIRVWQGKDD